MGTMRALPIALLTALVMAPLLPTQASAQGFGIRVTPQGIDQLTEVAFGMLPEEHVIAAMDRELYDCPGSRLISA